MPLAAVAERFLQQECLAQHPTTGFLQMLEDSEPHHCRNRLAEGHTMLVVLHELASGFEIC